MRKLILHPTIHHLVLHKWSPFTEPLIKAALRPDRIITTVTLSDPDSRCLNLLASFPPKLRIIGCESNLEAFLHVLGKPPQVHFNHS